MLDLLQQPRGGDSVKTRTINTLRRIYNIGDTLTSAEARERLMTHKPTYRGTYTKRYIPSGKELGAMLHKSEYFQRLNAGESPAVFMMVE